MILRKKWLVMLAVITALLLLAACGDKESVGEVPAQDGPQDSSPEDFMPLSEGFEEYSVWIETSDTPDRNSSVRAAYVFENGEVTRYYNISDQDKQKIEEINDLTDDEIIQYVKEVATMKDSGKYSLDITLDSLGQDTQKIDVILENYTHIWTFDIDSLSAEKGLSNDEYIASLEEEGREFVIDGEYITFTSIEEEPNSILTIDGGMVSQKIFDTTYSGLRIGDSDSLLTRVDDSSAGFKVDGPDTQSKNVTIEGK